MLMGHQGMTTSQKRSIGRNLVSHVLRGKNGESIDHLYNFPLIKL